MLRKLKERIANFLVRTEAFCTVKLSLDRLIRFFRGTGWPKTSDDILMWKFV